MNNIGIKKAKGTRSCQVCDKANYKDHAVLFTSDPAEIYEIRVGCTVVALCEGCLKVLFKKIDEMQKEAKQ